MAATMTRRGYRGLGGVDVLHFTLAFTGSYVIGGEVQTNPFSNVDREKREPDFILASGRAGFVYQYEKSSKKWLVYCNTAGAANAALGEHTAAAYVAGITGDVINGVAVWAQIT